MATTPRLTQPAVPPSAAFSSLDAENVRPVFDWLCTSGQPTAEDITRIATLGFGVVVNLALPTSVPALADEAKHVTGAGLRYVTIPVEWTAPQLDQLTEFFGVIKAFEDQKLWVHCARNYRVSVFISLYRRLCLGEPAEQSASVLDSVWTPDLTWQAFVDDALATQSHADSNWHRFARGR